MSEIFKNLMNLDKPVLTEKLAPKVAPFAKIIYLIVLVILALTTLGSLKMLFSGYIIGFLGAFLGVILEFTIVRMFCEYLTKSGK